MLIQLFKGETKLKAKLKMNVFKRQNNDASYHELDSYG